MQNTYSLVYHTLMLNLTVVNCHKHLVILTRISYSRLRSRCVLTKSYGWFNWIIIRFMAQLATRKIVSPKIGTCSTTTLSSTSVRCTTPARILLKTLRGSILLRLLSSVLVISLLSRGTRRLSILSPKLLLTLTVITTLRGFWLGLTLP